MKSATHRRFRRLAAAIAVATSAIAVFAAGAPAQATQYVNINGEGSSWAGVAWHQWQSNAAADGVTFNYTPNGSSAGRDDFANQTSAMFADSEIPFTGDADDPQDDTLPNFQYSMLPVVAGGTAFAYNLPIGGSNYVGLRLNMEDIAKIFSGEITKWNNRQIAALNPGVQLPDQGITVVVRSDGSGATAQFKLWMLRQWPSEYRHLAAETGGDPNHASSYFPVGNLSSCGSGQPCFVAQSGSNGVTDYVLHTPYSIDYDEYAYALNVNLPVAEVENAAGFFTLPTQYAVAVALIAAKIDMDKSSPDYLSQNLSDVYTYGDPRAYPMSMYSYELIPDQTTRVLQDPQGATLAWVSTNAVCSWQADMGALGYSPLPMNLVLASMEQIEKVPGINASVMATITGTQKGVTSGTSNPCNSPTFKPGQSPSDNVLVQTAPFPPGCNAACQAPWKGKTIDQGPGSAGSGHHGHGHTGPGSSGSPAPGSGSSPAPGSGSSPGGSTDPSSCNAVTGVCTGPSPGQVPSPGAGQPYAGNSTTTIPAASGWASPQTLSVMLIILLLALLIVPPVVASRARRRRG
jgi:phosphate transport system substrate-binding protein